MLRYYIDTCIWMDLLEGRKDYDGGSLSEKAFNLILDIKARGDRIIVTEQILQEFSRYYSPEEIKSMLSPFSRIIERLNNSPDQIIEAKKISSERNVPFGDALHTITARDNSLILVTRDAHFRILSDISEPYTPEELV
mgnify:CR=1 FL=1